MPRPSNAQSILTRHLLASEVNLVSLRGPSHISQNDAWPCRGSRPMPVHFRLEVADLHTVQTAIPKPVLVRERQNLAKGTMEKGIQSHGRMRSQPLFDQLPKNPILRVWSLQLRQRQECGVHAEQAESIPVHAPERYEMVCGGANFLERQLVQWRRELPVRRRVQKADALMRNLPRQHLRKRPHPRLPFRASARGVGRALVEIRSASRQPQDLGLDPGHLLIDALIQGMSRCIGHVMHCLMQRNHAPGKVLQYVRQDLNSGGQLGAVSQGRASLQSAAKVSRTLRAGDARLDQRCTKSDIDCLLEVASQFILNPPTTRVGSKG